MAWRPSAEGPEEGQQVAGVELGIEPGFTELAGEGSPASWGGFRGSREPPRW